MITNSNNKKSILQNSLLTNNNEINSSFDFVEYDKKLTPINDKDLIGVDETGVGDYFGPLVAAAVYVPKEKIDILKKIRIRDSKEIKTEKELFYLYQKIKENCEIGRYVLSNEGYNRLYNRLRNSHKLKYFAHSHAINQLEKILEEKSKKYDYIFIDQYTTKKSLYKYKEEIFLNNNWSKITNFKKTVIIAHKAENIHISVACASIVARALLIQSMREMNKKYNFEFVYGAGKIAKKLVQDFKDLYGEEKLKEVCKMHFKTDND